MIPTIRRSALLLALAVLAQPALAQTDVTITPSKDVTLYESDQSSPLANGGGESLFVGTTGQVANALRRSLVAFDLEGQIPAGAVVQSAELSLQMTKAPQAAAFDLSLHRMLGDWGEGTSDASGGEPGLQEGDGTTPAEGDATWFDAVLNTVAWQTPGGDFEQEASATTPVGSNGTYVWGTTSEMVSDIQAWVNDPSQNFGWALIGIESSARTVKTFSSRSGASPPSLKVTFTTATNVEDQPAVVGSAGILSSFPNPFTTSTRVEYNVANPGHVRLDVYDTLGRRVSTLANGIHSPGRYAERFDAGDLPNGVYFVRIESGPDSRYRQVVLVR